MIMLVRFVAFHLLSIIPSDQKETEHMFLLIIRRDTHNAYDFNFKSKFNYIGLCNLEG